MVEGLAFFFLAKEGGGAHALWAHGHGDGPSAPGPRGRAPRRAAAPRERVLGHLRAPNGTWTPRRAPCGRSRVREAPSSTEARPLERKQRSPELKLCDLLEIG
jgi:hypothetical protein